MAINEHYNEVLDVIDRLFVYMFNGLKSRCGARPPLCYCLAISNFIGFGVCALSLCSTG